MGSGGMCVGPCTPAQRMAYSQSTASLRISRPAEQNQQAVSGAANSNVTAASKTAALSVPARSNSVLDVQA